MEGCLDGRLLEKYRTNGERGRHQTTLDNKDKLLFVMRERVPEREIERTLLAIPTNSG